MKKHSLLVLSQSFFVKSCFDLRTKNDPKWFAMKMDLSLKTKPFYFNRTFDKSRLKILISWSLTYFGEKKTIECIEVFKTLGYKYATKAGVSLSIDDLKIPSFKMKLLNETEDKLNYASQDVEKAYLTSIEYFAQVIDTWNNTSEYIKKEVIQTFKQNDILNPVYMMAFSGARGNISQVRQLVGMRGLMSDPSGRIIDFPIQSNFREGLTLTEYIISCYGARKGVVDTALRTATSGYLTRRLVDVAQHVIVRIYDCGTKRGIYLSDLKAGSKTLLSLKNRLIGRFLAETVDDHLQQTIGLRNQEITPKLAEYIIKTNKPILIRSPLTCQDQNRICQLCYGWALSNNRLVALGEAVGIIAAQSIGEPGTQLTMRTFHTGGVFSGEVSEQIRAPFDGFVLFETPIPGKLVRTTHGQIAFLTKQIGMFLLIPNKGTQLGLRQQPTIQKFVVSAYSLLFIKQNQKVKRSQILTETSVFFHNVHQSVDVFQTIYSEVAGEIYFKQSKMLQKMQQIKQGKKVFVNGEQKGKENTKIGEFWILSAQKRTLLKPMKLFVKKGDFLLQNGFLSSYFLNFIEKNPEQNFIPQTKTFHFPTPLNARLLQKRKQLTSFKNANKKLTAFFKLYFVKKENS